MLPALAQAQKQMEHQPADQIGLQLRAGLFGHARRRHAGGMLEHPEGGRGHRRRFDVAVLARNDGL